MNRCTLFRQSSLAVAALFGVSALLAAAETDSPKEPAISGKICVSGIYPHLAALSTQGEVGIGAVVPWVGKLWWITYPPHFPQGSPDKLYEVDPDMTVHIRPESVGGTDADRMIHRESNQLIIGPYFIDDKGQVRVADVHQLVGRLTAAARHLTDPANKVYIIDMEGAIYEVDVHSLAVKKLFEKPVPGWHGKGGYTSQGRLVISNNGESAVHPVKTPYLAELPPKSPEDAGVLAEWDGKTWKIDERREFTEVTGPGGISGAPDDHSPLWSVGWDKRSVILKLLDDGKWQSFRLPKASHAYDPKHGWYTEWPRIREVAKDTLMLDMHGMFYRFPSGFSAGHVGGITPIASHLRMVPDFCDWNGRLVLASDDASLMQNPMAGTSQSNLWFGTLADLDTFGPRSGWGGVWLNDAVHAGEASAPFLVNGFENRVLHLSHDSDSPLKFTIEADAAGDGQWKELETVTVPAHGYRPYLFQKGISLNWVRVKADRDCTATAYFHLTTPRVVGKSEADIFASLPKISDPAPITAALIRPGAMPGNLQCVFREADAPKSTYLEADRELHFAKPDADETATVEKIAAVKKDFDVDAASVIMTQDGIRYRLPKNDAAYDRPFSGAWPRGIRECITERFLVNVHGSFYEMPREKGLPLIKPVCTHGRKIMDFCTWRGLLVMSGTLASAKPDGHYFAGENGADGLWFGSIDDLWKLGKPVGTGGPWLHTAVKAGAPSDAYLMTGYDKKKLELSNEDTAEVKFTVQVDTDHTGFKTYDTFTVPAGKTVTHVFPDGFSAHWVRVVADHDCTASATFTYE